MDTLELEARELLTDWVGVTDGEPLRVENCGPFWLIAGKGPDGVSRSGTRSDPVSLARDLAEQGRYVEPEPVAVEPVTPDDFVPTLDDASDESFAPAEEEDGSLIEEEAEPAASEIFDLADLLEPQQPGGIGVMVNNTGGVMAADRTEELRAKRIGETVIEHRRLVDASYTVDEARTLQQLRSRSNAAADGSGNQLTDEEQGELDRLALEEMWAARMDAELQRRLTTLNGADHDALQTYRAKGEWPE